MGDTARETRNRSRSKTPFLRSQCDSESCAHAGEEGHIHHHHEKKKKTPNVQTIIEETVEVTRSPATEEKSKKVSGRSTVTTVSSSSASVSTTTNNAGKRTITSDYSSEDVSPETVARLIRSNADNKSTQGSAMQKSSYTATSTTTTTVVTSAQRIKENKNFKNISTAAMTSTPKAAQQQSFSTAFGDNREMSQNASNLDFDRSDQQTKSNNNSSSKNFYSEQSNGSLSEHVAYKEYKDAGDYWNKYPKTDYTYSKRSPHRREILPGVIGMPNMSRRSLENHNDRVTEMVQRDPVKEEFIRRRYAYQCTNISRNSSNMKAAAENLIYDSQDEVDLAQFESYRKSKRYLTSTASTSLRNESWFTRVVTSVVTIFSSFWSTISGGKSESELYRTRIAHEQRGVFGRMSQAISSVFLGLFRYVYMAISSVLSLDTWLLKTSNAENKSKKRFLLLLLLLLPLLLLAGLYYYLNPTEPFPPRSLSDITLTLPSFDLSEFYSQEKYDALKANAFNRIDDFKEFTNEYFAYLKTVSMNVFEEGKKLFQQNVYYERV